MYISVITIYSFKRLKISVRTISIKGSRMGSRDTTASTWKQRSSVLA